jgi:hypothetical protein
VHRGAEQVALGARVRLHGQVAGGDAGRDVGLLAQVGDHALEGLGGAAELIAVLHFDLLIDVALGDAVGGAHHLADGADDRTGDQQCDADRHQRPEEPEHDQLGARAGEHLVLLGDGVLDELLGVGLDRRRGLAEGVELVLAGADTPLRLGLPGRTGLHERDLRLEVLVQRVDLRNGLGDQIGHDRVLLEQRLHPLEVGLDRLAAGLIRVEARLVGGDQVPADAGLLVDHLGQEVGRERLEWDGVLGERLLCIGVDLAGGPHPDRDRRDQDEEDEPEPGEQL